MPAPKLAHVAAPAHTALVTQECQGAVVGPDAGLGELAAAARATALPNIVRLAESARRAGVTVIHCLVNRRPDGRGSNTNAPIFSAAVALGLELEPGTPGASLVAELGPAASDLVLTRTHGLGPMAGTDLDSVMRNLGIRTVVATGVSTNLAITNLVMDAANAGYQVVLPRDAVAGVPADYSDAVIDNTLSLLATITTTRELLDTWDGS